MIQSIQRKWCSNSKDWGFANQQPVFFESAELLLESALSQFDWDISSYHHGSRLDLPDLVGGRLMANPQGLRPFEWATRCFPNLPLKSTHWKNFDPSRNRDVGMTTSCSIRIFWDHPMDGLWEENVTPVEKLLGGLNQYHGSWMFMVSIQPYNGNRMAAWCFGTCRSFFDSLNFFRGAGIAPTRMVYPIRIKRY